MITEEEYNLNPKYCKECGKKIEYYRMLGTFCNSSCAAKYNNKKRGRRTEEEKRKISIGVKNSIKIQVYKERNKQLRKRTCVICGKEFYNLPHKYRKTCSKECEHILRSRKSSESRKREIENGTFKGWMTRKITFYPEKFFIKVLENNSIPYIREFLIHCNNTKYFLDFKIEHNNRLIDLEIDGKQHKYPDRIKMDSIRDKNLISLGYEIYRIDWNEINTENGKLKMKEKINKFLEFYNKF